jgi:nucleoside-diphosphate-sugar epimerase
MVLVTGASGFVGRRLVEILLQRGARVRAMLHDPLKKGTIPAGADVVIGDILDQKSLAEALHGISTVHHCAAAVGNHFSKAQIYQVNFTGVKNLFDCIRSTSAAVAPLSNGASSKHDWSTAGSTRIVILSSVNVLGTRNLAGATEAQDYRYSQDPAADVKIEAERLALDYHRKYDLDVTIIRPGFIYGPGDHHNLPKLMSAIQRGKFRFIGSRDHVIPIVHVDDVVQAMILAAETPATKGMIYHITDGSRIQIGEFVTALSQMLGTSVPEKVLPYYVPALGCTVFEWLSRLGLRKKPAPIARNSLRFLGTSRFFDLQRARTELGYTPSVQFQQGMASAVRWCQEQGHGISSLSS